jgi:hypothetical protein
MGTQHTKTSNPNEASAAVSAISVLMLPELISIKDRLDDWWIINPYV